MADQHLRLLNHLTKHFPNWDISMTVPDHRNRIVVKVSDKEIYHVIRLNSQSVLIEFNSGNFIVRILKFIIGEKSGNPNTSTSHFEELKSFLETLFNEVIVQEN